MKRLASASLVAAALAVLPLAGTASAAPITAGGPGGLDKTNLQIWLKADALSLANGAAVSSWTDSSGKTNTASQTAADAQPTFVASVAHLNNLPAVQFFRGSDEPSPVGSDFMETANTVTLNGTESVFAVWDAGDYPDKIKCVLGSRLGTYIVTSGNAQTLDWQFGGGGANVARVNKSYSDYTSTTTNRAMIFAGLRDVTDGTSMASALYQDGSLIANTTHTAIGDAGSVKYILGAQSRTGGAPNNRQMPFDGLLPEIFTFNRRVNAAERIVIENYLSAKYNQALTANDFYAGDTAGKGDYDFDVFGIGQTDGVSVVTAGAAGFGIESTGGLANGQWVFAGHKIMTNTVVDSSAEGISGERWSRVWYVDVTGAPTGARFGFDLSDGGIGGSASRWTDLFYSVGQSFVWTRVAAVRSEDGDRVFFDLSAGALLDGFYTLGSVPRGSVICIR